MLKEPRKGACLQSWSRGWVRWENGLASFRPPGLQSSSSGCLHRAQPGNGRGGKQLGPQWRPGEGSRVSKSPPLPQGRHHLAPVLAGSWASRNHLCPFCLQSSTLGQGTFPASAVPGSWSLEEEEAFPGNGLTGQGVHHFPLPGGWGGVGEPSLCFGMVSGQPPTKAACVTQGKPCHAEELWPAGALQVQLCPQPHVLTTTSRPPLALLTFQNHRPKEAH